MAARRGHGDDSIYWDESKNRYVGAISLGWSANGQRRIRRKVRGRTKTEVRDKLRDLRSALDGGIRPSARYTVQQAVDDWLEHGLDGRSLKTLSAIREVLAPVTEQIGKVKLHELTAAAVRMALAEAAKSRATRTVQAAHSALVRAITYAQANDLVARNVAALIQAPKGQQGRLSKSLTLSECLTTAVSAGGSAGWRGGS